jgi:TonB-linked SusC/RagA family outer membrane protein
MFFLTAGFLHVQATGLSQSITLAGKNMEMKQVFAAIKKQTGYVVFSRKGLLDEARPVSVTVRGMPLIDFLDLIVKDQPFTYLIVEKTISLSHKETPAAPLAPAHYKPKGPPVTGHILDATGRPLAGASVLAKRSKTSTVSGPDGSFKLDVSEEEDVLVVSYVGYELREMKLTPGSSSLIIRLQQSNSQLDQVQIIGYGSTTKRLNPGDVTTITSKDIEKSPVVNVLEAIQGKVPGLFIQQTTGQPGGAFNIRLRGSANFSQGAIPPLVIVDGVRFPAGALPVSGSSWGPNSFLQGGSGLNYLNPADIESIDILKDADATAIYGSAGAYGVIIITTKKAKAGVSSLTGNVYTGISVNGQTAKLMNTEQYLMLRKEALKNDGLAIGSNDPDLNGTWPQDRYNNWRKELMGSSAQSTNASLTYSGGAQNTGWLVSGNLRSNGNIQKHKGSFNDGSLRFSLNTGTANEKFKFTLSGNYLASDNNMVPWDFSNTAILTAPNAPPLFLPDGSLDWSTGSNAAGDINRVYKNVTGNLMANGALVYKPVRQLTLRTNIGYNNISSRELMEYPTTTKAPTFTQASAQTHSVFHHYEVRTITVSPYAEYNTTLWKKGELSIKSGGEIDDKITNWDEVEGIGFSTDAMLADPSSGNTVKGRYSLSPFRSLGFYGIIKYVWDHKYIIDLNGRRDGSTKFGPSNRFGNFGSVAAAWIFSEEKLVKDHARFISFGKLRGSYGIVGGDAIDDFAYLSTWQVQGNNYDGKVGLQPSSLANPSLRWEKNKDAEAGLEIGFLNNRIYVEANYYSNLASNQLISQPVSSVTGFSSVALNSDAVIRNNGWELYLNTTNVKTKNFTWSSRLNGTIPHSKLLHAPTQTKSPNYVTGKPVTGVVLYKYNGINPQTGYYNFTNAKGATDDYALGLSQTDKTEFIDLAPKFYGGLQNSFTYKQLSVDFSIVFTNRKGQNFLGQQMFAVGLLNANSTTDWLRRWQNPGDQTDMPRVSTNVTNYYSRQYNFVNSTGAYSDVSYARLQNVSIRYRFSRDLLQKARLKDLSVYLQGQNLYTFSRYHGLDPENLNPGVIPPLRVFTAGINFTL